MSKVLIVMGSKSDLDVVRPAANILKKFGVACDVRVMSAHRTPNEVIETVTSGDYDVFIAAAGKAAHLGGVMAAYTIKPVIGLPVKSSTMDGLDSLLSIVQMPGGVPVATVAINGGLNAGLLAIQILAVSDKTLSEKLNDYKKSMAKEVLDANDGLESEL